MNEEDARRVFDKIIADERFSYREAVRWAIDEINRLKWQITGRDDSDLDLYAEGMRDAEQRFARVHPVLKEEE